MVMMSQSRRQRNENQVSSVIETADMLERIEKKRKKKTSVMCTLNPASNTNEF